MARGTRCHGIRSLVETPEQPEPSELTTRRDPEKHVEKDNDPGPAVATQVAVIGAGISGLIAARLLRSQGLDVRVFEKSRGPGGRAATRNPAPGLSFDHGAQYLTARDQDFARYVMLWTERGVVAEWTGRIVEVRGGEIRPTSDLPRRFVGVPGMVAVGRDLAADVPLYSETRIARLNHAGGRWELTDTKGQTYGPFHHVIVTLPAPQAAELLDAHPFAAEARAVPMTPCWAVLAAFEQRAEVAWDGAFVQGSPLAWVARNSSKPGRKSEADCWVIHASPGWSAAHLELGRDAVKAALLAEFATLTRAPGSSPIYLEAHRWLFSATPLSRDRLALFDPVSGLTVCGDWLAGGRIEGAFRSGVAAAEHLLRQMGLAPKDRDRLPDP